MKTTKITLQAEIYDDPKWCSITGCIYSSPKEDYDKEEFVLCLLFGDHMKILKGGRFEKCDQCKAAWNELNKQTQDKT